MKKLFSLVAGWLLFSVTSLQVIACGNENKSEEYLEIDFKNGDIKDETFFKNIALDFMYDLPTELQPKADRDHFQGWRWTQSEDLKTLDCKVQVAVQIPDAPVPYHYWEVKIKKTEKRGLFVSWWKEHNYDPWD